MSASLHLEPIIEGNDAGDTLVFIQGWPDSAALWDEAVAALRGKYRCVRVTLPNYGTRQRETRWGFHTGEIIDALTDHLRRVVVDGRPVTLVLHDWGSYWGHVVHHRCPELVSRVATLDVAPHFKPTAKGLLGIVAYQWWLFAAFGIGGAPGDWMTRRFAKLFHVPNDNDLNAWMNYPYRNVWSDLLTGRYAKMIHGYWPTCPLLFVYGEKKPFMFHSPKWTDHVRSVRGGEVVSLPSNHWFTHTPAFVETLSGWLERTAADAKTASASSANAQA